MWPTPWGTCGVPTLVANQKKDKAATVPGFISQLKKLSPEIILPTDKKRHVLRDKAATVLGFISQLKNLSPEIILPTDKKRHVLRSTISPAVDEIGKGYKTVNSRSATISN